MTGWYMIRLHGCCCRCYTAVMEMATVKFCRLFPSFLPLVLQLLPTISISQFYYIKIQKLKLLSVLLFSEFWWCRNRTEYKSRRWDMEGKELQCQKISTLLLVQHTYSHTHYLEVLLIDISALLVMMRGTERNSGTQMTEWNRAMIRRWKLRQNVEKSRRVLTAAR